jgi:arylsulfatase
VALGLALLTCGCAETGRRAPSVVLITVDTLRADHLGCYGHERATSPHIDAFAADGLLFEHCYSHAPVTSSSCASILSGFLPHETTVYENLPLPQEVETLAERLQRVGYRTAGVVSNFNLRADVGWAQGFDVFDDAFEAREGVREMPERIAVHTTDRAIELIAGNRDRPLFLWVHYQDPHGPYTPPQEFAERFRDPAARPRPLEANETASGRGGIPEYQLLGAERDYHAYVSRYDGEIAYMDEQFGRLVEALREHGLYDEALIVFTADHGEGMGEHDTYFAHGENLYRGLTHVPLILKFGERWGGRRAHPVQHVDLVPTILAALALPADVPLRGADLDRGPVGGREVVAEMRSPTADDGIRYSLIVGTSKLVLSPLEQRVELYDLATDPGESRDLSRKAGFGQTVQDLRARLESALAEDRLQLPLVNVPPVLTEEEREKLKALGYLD